MKKRLRYSIPSLLMALGVCAAVAFTGYVSVASLAAVDAGIVINHDAMAKNELLAILFHSDIVAETKKHYQNCLSEPLELKLPSIAVDGVQQLDDGDYEITFSLLPTVGPNLVFSEDEAVFYITPEGQRSFISYRRVKNQTLPEGYESYLKGPLPD